MSKRIMILLGGAHHDFDGYEAASVSLFGNAGYEPITTRNRDDLKSLDDSIAAVVVYTSYGGAVDKQGRKGTDLSADQATALRRYVAGGGGLLGVHCATVVSEPDSKMHKLLGGRFVDHPPIFTFAVSPMRISHPVTDGVDQFSVCDEFYIQDVMDDCQILMTATDRGVCHPMVWVRHEGEGRVAYVSPGHDSRAWELPEFKTLSVQGLNWVAAG